LFTKDDNSRALSKSIFKTECCSAWPLPLDIDLHDLDDFNGVSRDGYSFFKYQQLLKLQLIQLENFMQVPGLNEDENFSPPLLLIFHEDSTYFNEKADYLQKYLVSKLLPSFSVESENYKIFGLNQDDLTLKTTPKCPYQVNFYPFGSKLSKNFTNLVDHKNHQKSFFIIDFKYDKNSDKFDTQKIVNSLKIANLDFLDSSEGVGEEDQDKIERIIRSFIYSIESEKYFQEGRFEDVKVLSFFAGSLNYFLSE